MQSIRQMLASLLGQSNLTEDQLTVELSELKLDNQLAAITGAGHLAADPETQTLARKFLAQDADGFTKLISTPKPTPAAVTTITPPAGPISADPAETAIQQRMAAAAEPYHVAAAAVAAGGAIHAQAEGA